MTNYQISDFYGAFTPKALRATLKAFQVDLSFKIRFPSRCKKNFNIFDSEKEKKEARIQIFLKMSEFFFSYCEDVISI